MKCSILKHKSAKDNTKQFIADVGGMRSFNSNEIADYKIFMDATKQLEQQSIKSYGVSGRPWLADDNGFTAVPNYRVLRQIDNVRKRMGLYEDKLPVGAKLNEVVKLKEEQAIVVSEPSRVDTNKLNQIQQLFKDNPELSQIGTIEQYAAYLDTIFPNSKVKDIVYHGSNQKIEQFEVRKEPLIHFGTKNAALQRGNVLSAILLNIKDLQTIKDGMWFLGTDEGGLLKELLDRNILTIEEVKIINEAKDKAIRQSPYFNENYRMALPEGEKAGNKKLQEILQNKNIGFKYVNFSEDKGSTSFAVPSQEQIHILGNKQDIEGFKQFVDNKNRQSNIQYQLPRERETEEYVATEKTIRELAVRMSERIGIPVVFENNPNKKYKGKLEDNVAYINLAYATLDTSIHEILGHPIIRTILKSKPELYQSLLKELETGRGKEVLDRIKRDYKSKDAEGVFNTISNGKNYTIIYGEGDILTGLYLVQEKLPNGESDYVGNFDINDLDQFGFKLPEYTLEEQQEEAIVELLGLYTADRLNVVKDGKLISLLKRLLKEIKDFMRSLLRQREVDIDKLPDNMTLGDLADLLAYSNSKLILPGYEVVYTTPDNQKFKTYAEASKHISDLAKSAEQIDVDTINVDLEENKNRYSVIGFDEDGADILFRDNLTKEEAEEEVKKRGAGYYVSVSENSVQNFIEGNREYELSKDIVEEWKRVNNIQYNPDEVYSRNQEFVSVLGAYSNFDVKLLLQNLLFHIEDNQKAGGEFTISAFTKPVNRRLTHLEGKGGKIRFKIYPQPNDIKWAASADVFSGSVWKAPLKINKNKRPELLGVSYTKYPDLNKLSFVQPNLAFIIDNLADHHNELGITLTGSNFRLEYDEDIPSSTKKIIDSVNSILDQKYGKVVKPEFTTILKQPTQTHVDLKESFKEVRAKIASRKGYSWDVLPTTDVVGFENQQGYLVVDFEGDFPTKKIFRTEEEARDWIYSNRPKEVPSQALINIKIAKLKEVAKKYPRNLIASEVIQIDFTPTETGLFLQKVSEPSEQEEVSKRIDEAESRIPINKRAFKVQTEVRQDINRIISGEVFEVNESTTQVIYSLLDDRIKKELTEEGITSENFNKSFNSQLQKLASDSWFVRVLEYIKQLFIRDRLYLLARSIQTQQVTPLFTEKGKMLIYGITSNQGRKTIPLINQMLYRSITPANYKIGRVLGKAGQSLFVGKSYADFIETINKWREQDLATNELTENKLIPEWATRISEESYNKREDAWRLSNGLPQKHNSFKYIGRGFLDSEANLIPDENGEDIYGFVNPQFNEKDIARDLGIDKTNAVMGKYAIKIGKDNLGHYIQYNDRWDLDILNPIINKAVDLTQTPFIITGKIYKALEYDPENQVPFVYYTHDETDPNIQAYTAQVDLLNEEEFLAEKLYEISQPGIDNIYYQLIDNKVDYQLRIVTALQSDKVRQPKINNLQGFFNDIQKQGIPSNQLDLLREIISRKQEGFTKEDLVVDLLAEYSYTIEINIAKERTDTVKPLQDFTLNNDNYTTHHKNVYREYYKNNVQITEEEYDKAFKEFRSNKPTQYYSNLTVPGGTNYTENEIATPSITPSIKGHAQFSTDKGIGWFRSDDKVSEQKKEFSDLLNRNKIEDTERINELRKTKDLPTKTRRILEVQSDLFQKGRDNENLINEYSEEYQNVDGNTIEEIIENRKNIKSNQFLQLLNKDSNWVTFFVKSIIQSTAKERIYEASLPDIEEKVLSLQKEGKLKIDCR